MPKLTIDGKVIEVKEGTTVFEAARQNEIPIPHFCYHPKLSIAGNCRMCLVQIEKQPKPAISCNTVAMEGMVVNTKTPEVKALQKNVLEFILINHPIDCPVCDQAGECRLQEYYMDYTMTDSDFDEEKVKKPKKVDLGPLVMLDDERCILCSRCIRFCDEITKTGELCFINRGDQSTLATFPGKQLDNKYSLNTVDICPVGALTSKPFRFKKRVWFLKSVPSICTGCATGCNIFIDHDDGTVWRYKTRDNEAVNQCWTCDEGRMSYPFINETIDTSPHPARGRAEAVSVADAMEEIIQDLKWRRGRWSWDRPWNPTKTPP
jgi:NADH-quinone oxidoreductase subunit G